MDVTTAEIRTLVNREGNGTPVTSVYLNTDGARYPKASDYEARLDALLKDARRRAEARGDGEGRTVAADADAISRWVRSEFDRSGVKGLGLFARDGEVFEHVSVALGVRNVARVDERPYVVPLQALLGRHHKIALVVVARDRARIFRHRLGVTEEYQRLESDVHGKHEQGGWSQARFSRGIEHERLHHFKDTAEVLQRLAEEEGIDALVLAGPHEEAVGFRRTLHPYVEQVVHGEPLSLRVDLTADDLTRRLTEVEQELVSRRRAELLQRLAAAQGQAERAARGLRHVVEASNARRIETLFVVEGAGQPGYRSSSGALALHEEDAKAFGTPVEAVDDLIDEVIEQAVLAGSHIELFRDPARLDGDPVAALLRF